MYQITITEKEEGQRFDKYLRRILPEAGSSFLYKMLRKKNITLNEKKADGSEKITAGDCVKIFFAQDTLAKFMGKRPAESEEDPAAFRQAAKTPSGCQEYVQAYRLLSGIKVIYEDERLLLADKPSGILSQKAVRTDVSLNEWLIGYLLAKGELSESSLTVFKPSVCNRLDRNTSGIVLCAKSLKGAQMLGRLLKERTLHKYYQLYVKGHIGEEQLIEGYLVKDEKRNRVSVVTAPPTEKKPKMPRERMDREERWTEAGGQDGSVIRTKYRPLRIESDKTLLEAELITGKPHQIRAHLASIGHPLLGDYKYGDRAWNEKYRQKYGVRSQLLHACKVVFPPLEPPFADVSGRTFFCELPEIFERVSS